MIDNLDFAAQPADRVGATPEVSDRRSVFLSEFDTRFAGKTASCRREVPFIPDLAYERQEGVREAVSAVRDGAPIVFVSGRAGTGKSRLIEYLREMPGGGRQVVVAPTGVAALALRASTIHAFFRLPVGVIDSEALAADDRPSTVIRRMRRLVIDEVSMVRADILDGIDRRLRLARESAAPFGGVQVVLVGDFLQLPPVVRDADRELIEALGYATPFAFSARAMQRTPIRVATLKKVWRQSDPEMIGALGAIREGRNVEAAIAWLNARCAGSHRPGSPPLLLTATRAAAEAYNADGVAALRQSREDGGPESGADAFRLAARAGGIYENERTVLPAPRELVLDHGTRVMAVKNDPAGAFVNGSLGAVVGFSGPAAAFEDAFVDVLFDGAAASTRLSAQAWTKTRQSWDADEGRITDTVTGMFEQIPLIIGYAITIHKSQGLTLTDLRIDLGRGAFAPGQLYVALSRAQSVEGLSFVRPIEVRDVRVDEMLLRFLDWVRSADNLAFEAAPAVPAAEARGS